MYGLPLVQDVAKYGEVRIRGGGGTGVGVRFGEEEDGGDGGGLYGEGISCGAEEKGALGGSNTADAERKREEVMGRGSDAEG